MPIQRFVVGPMANNTYIIHDEASREAAIVDPGKGSDEILALALEQRLTVRYVLDTHGHSDHTFNNGVFTQGVGASLMIGEADEAMLAQNDGWLGQPAVASPMADAYLLHEQELQLGSTVIQVIATPGHTPGSACFVYEDAVLTGDTLFQGSIGRYDFPGGSLPELLGSIKTRLFALTPDTIVLPGHNDVSTIRDEQRMNPFVGERSTIDLSRYTQD